MVPLWIGYCHLCIEGHLELQLSFFCGNPFTELLTKLGLHLWPFSKSKFNLKSDRVNLVAPASPIKCLLHLPNVRAIQYKLGPEKLTQLGNSNVLRLPVWQGGKIVYNFSAKTFKIIIEQSLKMRIFMIHNDLNEIYMSQLYVPRNHYIYFSAVTEPPSERGGVVQW